VRDLGGCDTTFWQEAAPLCGKGPVKQNEKRTAVKYKGFRG